MNWSPPAIGLGWLIALLALLVLVVALVLWISGHVPDKNVVYGLVCALAVARLVP